MRKINKEYISHYSSIRLAQPLAKGNVLYMTFTPNGNSGFWIATFSTNKECVYHVCPYDGIFRNCRDCGALDEDFDVNFCLKKRSHYSAGVVCDRINDCLKAGLEVKFVE